MVQIGPNSKAYASIRAAAEAAKISSTASSATPESTLPVEDLASALDKLRSESSEQHVIVLRTEQDGASQETNPDLQAGSGIKADLHDEAVHGPHGGKTWDELGEEQKKSWIKKMKDAGHYMEDLGETIFKGVVFSEIAGAIGQAVAGA
jgi:hypothetical protein